MHIDLAGGSSGLDSKSGLDLIYTDEKNWVAYWTCPHGDSYRWGENSYRQATGCQFGWNDNGQALSDNVMFEVIDGDMKLTVDFYYGPDYEVAWDLEQKTVKTQWTYENEVLGGENWDWSLSKFSPNVDGDALETIHDVQLYEVNGEPLWRNTVAVQSGQSFIYRLYDGDGLDFTAEMFYDNEVFVPTFKWNGEASGLQSDREEEIRG